MRAQPQMGDKIIVIGGHWLRPLENGKIVEISPKRGNHCYLVEFDESGPGFDNKLYLDNKQFEVVKNKSKKEVK